MTPPGVITFAAAREWCDKYGLDASTVAQLRIVIDPGTRVGGVMRVYAEAEMYKLNECGEKYAEPRGSNKPATHTCRIWIDSFPALT